MQRKGSFSPTERWAIHVYLKFTLYLFSSYKAEQHLLRIRRFSMFDLLN